MTLLGLSQALQDGKYSFRGEVAGRDNLGKDIGHWVPLGWSWHLGLENRKQQTKGAWLVRCCTEVPALGRLLSFLFQNRRALLAWSTRSVCPLAPETARAFTSMKCVRSNVWMAAAALVINFPLYLLMQDLASVLGLGKPDEGHLCLFPVAEIRGFLFIFKESSYRVVRMELVFIFNSCFPVALYS